MKGKNMPTISSIIQRRKGTAGHWRVNAMGNTFELWHYRTRMLQWADTDTGPVLLNANTGHGSVSDQQGMNVAFKVLNLPYYFSRKGGAELITL